MTFEKQAPFTNQPREPCRGDHTFKSGVDAHTRQALKMSYNGGLMKSDTEWVSLIDKSSALSAKSKQSYKKQLRSVLRIFNKGGPNGISTILSDPDDAKKTLEHIPDNSLRSYLAVMLSLFKRGEEAGWFSRTSQNILKLSQKWSEMLHMSSKRYGSRIEDNKPSDRERESHASIYEWRNAFHAAYKKDPLAQETLLLAFHALMTPPLRGGDLSLVRLGYTPSGNCLYQSDTTDQWILLIRNHKTSASHGDLTRRLSPELTKVLERNLSSTPDREWLFMTQGGSPYSDSGFSSWKSGVFHEAFGRAVTTNSLRHEFVSSMDRQNQTTSEARHIAHQMGHGLHTQRQYIRFM